MAGWGWHWLRIKAWKLAHQRAGGWRQIKSVPVTTWRPLPDLGIVTMSLLIHHICDTSNALLHHIIDTSKPQLNSSSILQNDTLHSSNKGFHCHWKVSKVQIFVNNSFPCPIFPLFGKPGRLERAYAHFRQICTEHSKGTNFLHSLQFFS